jgi:uncharacterized protein (DUF952 family)
VGLSGERAGGSVLTRIYKILPRAAWEAALAEGVYRGSEVDRADGFIHLSAADQARETARRHFHGQADLVVLAVDAEALGAALRWERSRGGALFPHLHGDLAPEAVVAVTPAPLDGDGVPDLGPLAP